MLIRAENLGFDYPDLALLRGLNFVIAPGLTLVCGGESRGKSTLMRLLAGALIPGQGRLQRGTTSVFWENPIDPADDPLSARAWLDARRAKFPDWDTQEEAALIAAFGLAVHIDKPLYMLSTGSRRKVWLTAAAASGAALTLLDTPYSALDTPSRRVLSQGLGKAALDPRRAWVVADYELPEDMAGVALAGLIDLGG